MDKKHVIVKSRHPVYVPSLSVLLIVSMVIGGWLLFEYGRNRSGFDAQQARADRAKLIELINQHEQQSAHLRADKAIIEQAKEVDRLAYNEIDDTTKQLQSEILELKEEVTFYRGIVGTPESIRGLQIRNFRLVEDSQTHNFQFRLILTQFVRSNTVIRGNVELSILGVQDGIQIQLSQQQVVKQTPQGMKFRFKYFQEVAGDLVMPEGFVPLRVIVRLKPNGRSPIEKTFSWSELIA